MGFKVDDLAADVGEFLHDHPGLNVLIRRKEFTPSVVKIAIRLMVDHFNHTVWRTLFTPATFPPGSFDIQLYGTVYHLMMMAASLQTRNHLPYSDGGTSIAQFAKSGEYTALANQFLGHFKEQAIALKHQMNLEQGWGGVSSEYGNFGGFAYADGI